MATTTDVLAKAMAMLDELAKEMPHTKPDAKCASCRLQHQLLDLKTEHASLRKRGDKPARAQKPGTKPAPGSIAQAMAGMESLARPVEPAPLA